ncbi:hypothetical protein MASR2M15_21510 [Anaerolineales bacterium]
MRNQKFMLLLLICLILGMIAGTIIRAQEPPGEILVYTSLGSQPGGANVTQAGSIAWIDEEGLLTPILAMPFIPQRVIACSDKPVSNDRQIATFFAGAEEGSLYAVSGYDRVIELDTSFSALGCLGNGALHFTEDSKHLAYIDYPSQSAQVSAGVGRLRIHETENFETVDNFDNVSAFDVIGNQFSIISFIPNNKNEFVEAAILIWDGDEGDDIEVATLYSDPGCFYIDGDIKFQPDGNLALSIGHKCEGQNTIRAYVIEPENRTTTLVADIPLVGRFFSFTKTNELLVSPENPLLFFTTPDGVTNNTVGMKYMDTTGTEVMDLFKQDGVMPGLTSWKTNPTHPPQLSADKNFYAIVTNSPNQDAAIQLIDLNIPELSLTVENRARGQTIIEVLFTPDTQNLIFISGGVTGESNAIFMTNLVTGNTNRIDRGRFGRGIISPDGNKLALINWIIPDEEKESPYLNLIILELENGKTTTIFQGADIVDRRVTNARFAVPILWR